MTCTDRLRRRRSAAETLTVSGTWAAGLGTRERLGALVVGDSRSGSAASRRPQDRRTRRAVEQGLPFFSPLSGGWTQDQRRSFLHPDRLHPSEAGYAVMGSRYEEQAQQQHPRLGGLLLALARESAHQGACATGSAEERAVAAVLEDMDEVLLAGVRAQVAAVRSELDADDGRTWRC
jgi:hypothetical protein